jgi:hypothetical protein
MHTREFEIASATFEKIRAEFPALNMNVCFQPADVELAMDIPVQPGLSFKVWLNFQTGDELTLSASRFWYEWFPCTNQKKVDEYLEACPHKSHCISRQMTIEMFRGEKTDDLSKRLGLPSISSTGNPANPT